MKFFIATFLFLLVNKTNAADSECHAAMITMSSDGFYRYVVQAGILKRQFRPGRAIYIKTNEGESVTGQLVKISRSKGYIVVSVDGTRKYYSMAEIKANKTLYHSDSVPNTRKRYFGAKKMGEALVVKIDDEPQLIFFLGFVGKKMYFKDINGATTKVDLSRVEFNPSITKPVKLTSTADEKNHLSVEDIKKMIEKGGTLQKTNKIDQGRLDKAIGAVHEYGQLESNFIAFHLLKDKTLSEGNTYKTYDSDGKLSSNSMSRDEFVDHIVALIKKDEETNFESIGGNAGKDIYGNSSEARLIIIDTEGNLIYVGLIQFAPPAIQAKMQEPGALTIGIKKSINIQTSETRVFGPVEFILTNDHVLMGVSDHRRRLQLLDVFFEVLARWGG